MTQSMAEQADRARAEREMRERDEALQAQEDRDARTEEYLGADEYVVVAQLVQLRVRDDAGAFVVKHFNEGAVVRADDLDEDNLRHHVDLRFLLPVDADEARFAAPAGTPKPGEPPNVPVTEGTPVEMLPHEERLNRQLEAAERAERNAEQQDDTGTARPHGNASHRQWVDYAVANRPEGQCEEDARAEAQAMSRDDLRARYS